MLDIVKYSEDSEDILDMLLPTKLQSPALTRLLRSLIIYILLSRIRILRILNFANRILVLVSFISSSRSTYSWDRRRSHTYCLRGLHSRRALCGMAPACCRSLLKEGEGAVDTFQPGFAKDPQKHKRKTISCGARKGLNEQGYKKRQRTKS